MFQDPTKTKKYLKIALFGKGGTGKTRFALSFPNACVVDTERGTDPYRGKYEFKVEHANRWKRLGETLNWILKNPGQYETLVIDSATIFYQDLIQSIVDAIKARRGNEIMTRGDWGLEKRRWAGFLNQLVELPMHIVLSFRERDEYEEVTNKQGEEVLKKTGNQFMDADKMTEHLFDLAFRCYTEEAGKGKDRSAKYLIQCKKTRYEWMPLFSVHDITGKRPFRDIFSKYVTEMLDAPDAAPPPEPPAEKLVEGFGPEDVSKTAEGDARVEELKKKFAVTETGELPTGENLVGPGDEHGVPATSDEIKVLMTRAGQLKWPDGSSFKSAEGKRMIKELYDLESTKDLKKFQFEFLYREFGEVLAGRAHLALEGEFPVIVRNQEVSANK